MRIAESSNIEVGGSYARGHNEAGSDFLTPLYGVDLMFRWKPLRRAIYRSFVARSVQRDGTLRDIRVIRSLDPGGRRQAVLAAEQWLFNPGRRDGQLVDVLVTIVLDFRIQ